MRKRQNRQALTPTANDVQFALVQRHRHISAGEISNRRVTHRVDIHVCRVKWEERSWERAKCCQITALHIWNDTPLNASI